MHNPYHEGGEDAVQREVEAKFGRGEMPRRDNGPDVVGSNGEAAAIRTQESQSREGPLWAAPVPGFKPQGQHSRPRRPKNVPLTSNKASPL